MLPIFADTDTIVISLDTHSGVRTAEETEAITFDPMWGGVESCEVAIDGVAVTNATEAGELVWTPPAVSEPTVWTFRYKSGDVWERAYFKSAKALPTKVWVAPI